MPPSRCAVTPSATASPGRSGSVSVSARFRALAQELSTATPWPSGPRVRWWFAGVVALGAVALLLPRPAGWTGSYLFAEDGQVFLAQTLEGGFSTLLQPYAGYLHVVPRLISNVCALGGPGAYAACTDAGSVLVKVLVASLAFPVMAAYARTWAWGLVAASAVLMLPTGQQEVLGNLTNLRWFLVFAAFCSVMGIFTSRRLAIFAAVLAMLASLSDPMPIIFLPIALWRILGLRGWVPRLPALALALGVAVHVLHMQPGARGERGDIGDLVADPAQALANLVVRGPLATQFGMTGTQDALRLLGVPLAVATLVITGLLASAAWIARRQQPRSLSFALVLSAFGMVLLLITLSFPASYIALADIWSPSQPARYSTLAGLFLTPAIVLLMSLAWSSPRARLFGRLTTLAMAACLVAAYLGDAGGDARHSSGPTWQELTEAGRVQCREGISPAIVGNVPVYEGWTTKLRCDWLG